MVVLAMERCPLNDYFSNFERCRLFGWFLPVEVFEQTLPDSNLKRAAVLFLISNFHEEPHVLITTRSRHLSTHTGENALPGGMMEPQDNTLVETACREAFEEVHLEKSSYDVLSVLPPCTVGEPIKLVTTVVAVVKTKQLSLSLSSEVEHIFWVPLRIFLQTSNTRYIKLPWRGHKFSHTAFEFEEPISNRKQFIWGFTATVCTAVSAMALNRSPDFPSSMLAVSSSNHHSLTLQTLALTAKQCQDWSRSDVRSKL